MRTTLPTTITGTRHPRRRPRVQRPALLTWHNAAGWMDTEAGDYLYECFEEGRLEAGGALDQELSAQNLWEV